MRQSRLVINRRHIRAQQITALLMDIFRKYIPEPRTAEEKEQQHYADRDLAREILEQLWCDGAQMIMEGDRISAGLPPRNINGLTVDELNILESKLTMAMLSPSPNIMVVPGPADWQDWVKRGIGNDIEVLTIDLYDHKRRLEAIYRHSCAPYMVSIVSAVCFDIKNEDEMVQSGRYLRDLIIEKTKAA